MAVLVFGLQEHQFCDGTLHGAVITAHDAGFLKMEAGFVTSHLYAASHTLTDIDDCYAAHRGFLEKLDEPRFLRSIAAAVTAEDDATQVRHIEEVAHHVLLDAREEREHHNIGIQCRVRNHRTRIVGFEDVVRMEVELDASVAK